MIKPSAKVKKFYEDLTIVLEQLNELRDKRVDTYDNRSENWQDSDNGMEYQEDTDNLDNLISVLDDVETEFTNTFDF